MAGLKISSFLRNIGQNWEKNEHFAKKVLNIEISPGFWLIREGNDVSNIPSTNVSNVVIFSGGDKLPYPSSLTAYLPPPVPLKFVFIKWPKGMYFRLSRWFRSLSFWFWGDREKLEGMVTTPLGRWGLTVRNDEYDSWNEVPYLFLE